MGPPPQRWGRPCECGQTGGGAGGSNDSSPYESKYKQKLQAIANRVERVRPACLQDRCARL